MEQINATGSQEHDTHIKPHRPFEVVEYDPNWTVEFEIRRQKLEKILGDQVIATHHIGSTAIPGMTAKPQIDILVVVKDLNSIKGKYDEMSAEGFEPRGDYTGIGEEYFTEDDREGMRLASIHVLPQGHGEIEEQLNFRDYLIENENDRILYAATKRKLFATHKDDYPAYGKGKEDVIMAIRQRANQWASHTSTREDK